MLLIIGVFLSISFGSSKISLSEIFNAMRQGDPGSKVYKIISFVRIPRTLAAVLAGCALSVSGAILQSVLNNSLASPGIIGVNSGAGLFAVLIAAFSCKYILYYFCSLYRRVCGCVIGLLYS